MTRNKYIIIGISGVTGGGKTSLCNGLMKKFGQTLDIIHMDKYYMHRVEQDHVYTHKMNGHFNWEVTEAIDFENLYKDVFNWKRKASTDTNLSILLIDGIIIFNYRPLVPLFDKKYFFTLQKEECWRRRKLRDYFPFDPVGYFDDVAWPMYLQNKAKLKDVPDIVYLDGNEDADMTFNFVLQDINNFLNAPLIPV